MWICLRALHRTTSCSQGTEACLAKPVEASGSRGDSYSKLFLRGKIGTRIMHAHFQVVAMEGLWGRGEERAGLQIFERVFHIT